jgi:predicted AAA+ superfamily ATPase
MVNKSNKQIHRNVMGPALKLALSRNKMLLLSGPRQCGKTTMAKALLLDSNSYFNWDNSVFKKSWIRENEKFAETLLQERQPRILLDEFHKNPKWKNQLKGFYDTYGDKIQIIVTGSAHLDSYQKGSDSLLGRFLHFHLHALSLGEISNLAPWNFKEFSERINSPDGFKLEAKRGAQKIVDQLLRFSGFPEPYLNQNEAIHQIWSKTRLELLIRQDLRDVSNLLKNNQVDVLTLLLPDKIGSPLSVQSLAEDLDVAHTTVTRWLNSLKQVYYHFDLTPYSKNIARSLKKESKIYLYDWSLVESAGPRFENMVACHLKKMVDYYNDTGQAALSLRYLRDKERNEVDFIILKNEKPFASIEAKLNDLNLSKTFLKFRKKYNFPHFQIVLTPDVYRSYQSNQACVIDFARFFQKLP